ncbi:MAG: hypothetical protein QNJ45_29305 [Ardenticatenaceae bacterium]|nr:hypothetical protein [Ardenticatenaceae bacterium]
MSLQQALTEWDDKSAADMRTVYSRHLDDDSFTAALIEHIAHEPWQKGATWLLKRHLEEGNKLTPQEIEAVYHLMPQLVHWETRLHILQCIPFMPIAAAEAEIVYVFLQESLRDKVKFVRAWAYGGFFELAAQHPVYAAEAQQLLDKALTEEAASVKARIRQIMRKGRK